MATSHLGRLATPVSASGATSSDLGTARQLRAIALRRVIGTGSLVRRSRRLARQLWQRATHARLAGEVTRAHGQRVAAIAGVPVGTQWRHQVWSALRYGFHPETYYRFKMYRASSPREFPLYVPVPMQVSLRGALYERFGLNAAVLSDKRHFYRRCVDAGVPVPPTVCDASDGEVHWWPGYDALPPCDLFSKEADAMCGAGAARWVWQGDGTYRAEDGSQLSAAEVVARLQELSRTAPLVLQLRLTNHPALLPYAHRALSTMRVATYRRDTGGVGLLHAFLRMPTRDVPADNYTMGGVACEVDPDTGRLGPGSFKSLEQIEVYVTTHPLTGAPIDGFEVPDWSDAVALCVRAHELFAEHFSIGWDVALTADGPVLVEGNYNWDVVLAQQPHGKPLLSNADFARSYLHWLTVPVADGPALNGAGAPPSAHASTPVP